MFGNIFYAEVFRSLAILVSNTSYVPILFMFIMAFLRPYGSLSSSTTKQFVTLVVIAGKLISIPLTVESSFPAPVLLSGRASYLVHGFIPRYRMYGSVDAYVIALACVVLLSQMLWLYRMYHRVTARVVALLHAS